jgi:hypothetical protein
MQTILPALFLAITAFVPAQLLAEEPTKDQRAQMAEMHTKAAECLKSEKPFEQCREEMMNNCPMAKDGQCPMMGRMRHGSNKSGRGVRGL